MGFLPTASEAGDSEAEVPGTSAVPHSHWLPPSPRLGKGSVVLWLLPGRRFVTRWPLRTQAPRRSISRQQPSPTTSLSGNPDSHQTSICFLRWWVISLAVVSVETEPSLQFRVLVGFQVKAVPHSPLSFLQEGRPHFSGRARPGCRRRQFCPVDSGPQGPIRTLRLRAEDPLGSEHLAVCTLRSLALGEGSGASCLPDLEALPRAGRSGQAGGCT